MPIISYYDQTVFSDPDNDIKGDCYRACIATLINVHPDMIPHFVQEDPYLEKNGDIKWLLEHGFRTERFATFNKKYKTLNDVVEHYLKGRVLLHPCMVTGRSPRHENIGHAVIWDNVKQFIYDPHPSRAGLVYNDSWWGFRFIVPVDEDLNLDDTYAFLDDSDFNTEEHNLRA